MAHVVKGSHSLTCTLEHVVTGHRLTDGQQLLTYMTGNMLLWRS